MNATEDAHLAQAVDATLKRMAALRDAEEQLERRRHAIRSMYTDGRSKSDVVIDLNNALRERGLTRDELKFAGVGHENIMKILRSE